MKTPLAASVKLTELDLSKKELTVSHFQSDDSVSATIRAFSPDKFLTASYMNDSPVLGWIIDAQEKLVWANQAFKDYFKLNEEAISNNVPGILPIKVIDGLYEKHVQVLNTQAPVETLQQVKLANGANITFHVVLFPVKGADNNYMIGGQAYRISEKLQAGKNSYARDQRHLLRLAGTGAIWEWNMRSGNIFRNDTLMKMIGYPLHEPDGLAWWFRRIHPSDRDRVSDKVKETTEKQLLFWEDEYRFKCADGEYKHIHDNGYIIYENGLPVKMIGSLHDISEMDSLQNQLLDEKLQYQKELSETVIRVQEKERARIGYELHDNINQVISTAKLFVDMFKPLNEEQQHAKDKSAEYLVMAIEEIRKLSKQLVTPQFRDQGIIDTLQRLINDISVSSGMQIHFQYDAACETLSDGKKTALFRIVQEQLKNIITHSGANKVEIELTKKEGTIVLVIKDNGCGFDSTVTRRGIGLSNIYERTKFYNGNAEIITEKNKGCALIICFPAS